MFSERIVPLRALDTNVHYFNMDALVGGIYIDTGNAKEMISFKDLQSGKLPEGLDENVLKVLKVLREENVAQLSVPLNKV